MSKISELDFFVALSKNESLAAAARDLDITPSAVTKRLAQMEERLGVRLINRTTRKINLTTEGEVYLSRAVTILSDIEEMEFLVSNRKETPGGLLRVNAPLGFGRRYLSPVISEFIKLYPGVEVQLTLTDAPVNLPDKSIDVVIRFGDIPDSRLVARKVADNRRLLCAAPSYLAKHGRPESAPDLLKHNCILLRQNNQTSSLWRLTRDDRTESIKVHSTLSSNDGEVVLKWALDGHGILMRAEWDLAKYVRSGRLELVLEEYSTPPADIYAVYLEKANLSAKVSVFVDYLRESFLIEEAGKIKMALW